MAAAMERLDETLNRPVPRRAPTVAHLRVKAAAVATDAGEFEALAATYGIDRQRDQIRRGAFENTIKRWRESGRRVPVHWNHETSAASIIGWIDPHSMSETDQGLYVAGKLDIDTTETARQAWRSMKNGTLSLSFGYMTNRSHKRSDGVKELLDVDMFEVSVVPHPANADTRFLSLKAGSRRREPMSNEELEDWAQRLSTDVVELDPDFDRLYAEAQNDILAALRHGIEQ